MLIFVLTERFLSHSIDLYETKPDKVKIRFVLYVKKFLCIIYSFKLLQYFFATN